MEIGYKIAERYVCKKIIGKGGCGSVYLAYDMKLDKNWAVKTSHRERPQERDALKSLDCSAFPRIVDVIHQDDTEFLIMDYVEGSTLADRCRLHATEETDILAWMIKVAEAIRVLHDHTPPLLYMDCKPDNIMLTNSGDIRLVDLGSVYAYDSEKKGTVSSTRFYAPGEVTSPLKSVNIGIYSDVYSFGMTMYRLLTGSNIEYRDRRHILCPEHKNKHISKASIRIIKRCTAVDPSKRYQSMQDIIRDLKSATEHLNHKHSIRIRINPNHLFDKLLKYALALAIVICGIYLDSSVSIPVISALFAILLILCRRAQYYSWEIKKSVIRAH